MDIVFLRVEVAFEEDGRDAGRLGRLSCAAPAAVSLEFPLIPASESCSSVWTLLCEGKEVGVLRGDRNGFESALLAVSIRRRFAKGSIGEEVEDEGEETIAPDSFEEIRMVRDESRV